MIKIIKRGTKQIAKCETCGCEFSYEQEDVCSEKDTYKVSINCPQCSHEVVLIQCR